MLLFTIVICFLVTNVKTSFVKINLTESYVSKTFSQIWTSTGFSPPSPHSQFRTYVDLDSFKQNIAMIGSLQYHPHLFQIRIHWLLDLILVNSHNHYDFKCLDQLVNMCTDNGLSLGFELMGNPGNIFNDFENTTQVHMWRDLVYQIVRRYSHLHSNWNYETWNEPDHHDFDGLNFTEQGYLNYVDACEKGVHDADSKAKFGGPGASCRSTGFSKLCWKFMDHVTAGRNYFTNTSSTKVDFISFHKKGGKRGQSGSSEFLYQSELDTLKYISNSYKTLNDTVLYNDEGDPVTGWDQPMSFRADVRYPAMVLRLIHRHLYSEDKGFTNYKMTSNDNAFLSYKPFYFTQRTLLAAFTINYTTVPYSVLVRKPIFELMSMLSQVRGQLITLSNLTVQADNTSTTGYIASHTDKQIVVSIWASNDTDKYTADPLHYIIDLPSHMMGGYYIIRQMNNDRLITWDAWQMLGSPGNLSRLDTEILWNMSMVVATKPSKVQGKIITKVRGPGVTQVIACSKSETLTTPYGLTCYNISTGFVIVKWKDEQLSDCFLTYELEIRRTPSDNFLPINNGLLLTNAYQFTSKYGVAGEYRVRSKNILGQTSKYSVRHHCES